MKVSAIIPAYNSVNFIEETLESLFCQTRKVSEIIVVDDGCTDNTCAVLGRIAGKAKSYIRLYRFPQNAGVSVARNMGLELAKEEWILFMDADDVAEPKLIENLCDRLSKFNSIAPGRWVLAHPAYIQMDEQGREVPGVHRGKQVEPEEILGYQLIRNQLIASSGTLVNKRHAIMAGGFDRSLRYSEDWDFWLRLAGVGGFVYVDEPLVRVRRHTGNTSRRIDSMLESEKQVLGKYSRQFIEEAVFRRKLSWEENTVDYIFLLSRLGFWPEVFRRANELVMDSPSVPAGYFLFGLCHVKHREWEKAADAFQITLKKIPSHGAALNNLGAIYLLKGDKKNAIDCFENALYLFPGYLDAKENLRLSQEERNPTVDEIKITWRQLRSVLTVYGD